MHFLLLVLISGVSAFEVCCTTRERVLGNFALTIYPSFPKRVAHPLSKRVGQTTEEGDFDDGLSVGAKAGIGLGVPFAAFLIFLTSFLVNRRKAKKLQAMGVDPDLGRHQDKPKPKNQRKSMEHHHRQGNNTPSLGNGPASPPAPMAASRLACNTAPMPHEANAGHVPDGHRVSAELPSVQRKPVGSNPRGSRDQHRLDVDQVRQSLDHGPPQPNAQVHHQ